MFVKNNIVDIEDEKDIVDQEENRNAKAGWSGRGYSWNYSSKVNSFCKGIESRVNVFKAKLLEVFDAANKYLDVKDRHTHEETKDSETSVDSLGDCCNQYNEKEDLIIEDIDEKSNSDNSKSNNRKSNF